MSAKKTFWPATGEGGANENAAVGAVGTATTTVCEAGVLGPVAFVAVSVTL